MFDVDTVITTPKTKRKIMKNELICLMHKNAY